MRHLTNIMDRKEGYMQIISASSKAEGGCNACINHDEHRVWVFTLRSSIFRLCDDCMKELKDKIETVKQE